MVITRYIADRIFVKDYQAIVPAFIGIIIISIIVHAIIGYACVNFVELGFGIEVTAVALFITIGTIWISMVVLSAAKEYTRILYSFIAGATLSIVAGYLLGSSMGLLGLITGFTFGQVLLLILLILQIFTEFEYRPRVEFYFLTYFKKFTSLAFIAMFYNIGIWADKFVFWFMPETSVQIHGFLRASYIYDTPIFLAYLFIIPSLAMFTIRVETSFYFHYRKYFLSILGKHPMSALEERKTNIINDLKTSIGRMLVLQGTISIIGIAIAPEIYESLQMSAIHLSVFQIAIMATFLQALLQTLLILILYFDFRSDALILAATYAFSNITLSILSINSGFAYYGYGYFGSCLLALMVGFILFNYRMKNLLYYTFASQKIITHKGMA